MTRQKGEMDRKVENEGNEEDIKGKALGNVKIRKRNWKTRKKKVK